MYAKAFLAVLLSAMAVNGHPAKRDDGDAFPTTGVFNPNFESSLDAQLSQAIPTTGVFDPNFGSSLQNQITQGLGSIPAASGVVTGFATTITDSNGGVQIASIGGAGVLSIDGFITTITGPVAPASADQTIGPTKTSGGAAQTGGGSTPAAEQTGGASPSPSGSKNAAAGLSVSKPLLTGALSLLGAVAGGAVIFL
ncbi:hypothetical protein C2E23DRAFT_287191 [Lenzites betulinus]|nr:hypothetical protein C2E23DRAFT_287191 [Lenzites betulinus]